MDKMPFKFTGKLTDVRDVRNGIRDPGYLTSRSSDHASRIPNYEFRIPNLSFRLVK